MTHLKTYLTDLELLIPIDYLTRLEERDGKEIRVYPNYSHDIIMELPMF